jgi:hypothetical protein
MMKKLIVGSAAVALVLACAVRFELVAQEEGVKAIDKAVKEAELDTAKSMAEAAEETYLATVAEYGINRTTMDSVYVWSRRWLDAELVLAGAQWPGDAEKRQDDRVEAFFRHLSRMEKLHERVAALHKEGAIGGEDSNFFGTKFFVAEAKLWAERAQDGDIVND